MGLDMSSRLCLSLLKSWKSAYSLPKNTFNNLTYCKLKLLNSPAKYINSINSYHTSCVLSKIVSGPKIDKDMTVSVLGVNDEQLGEMTYGDAEILASKDNFKLVVDVTTTSILCKLQKLSEDKHEIHAVKSKPKTLALKSKIADHDLQVKTENVIKWLHKGYEVSINIEPNRYRADKKKQSEIFKHITDAVKELATVKTSVKTTDSLTFQLKPKISHSESTQKDDDSKLKPWKLKDLKMEQKKKKEN